jgi:hypothetical protein
MDSIRKLSAFTVISASVMALSFGAQAQSCDAALAPSLKSLGEFSSVLTEEQAVIDTYTKAYNDAVAAKKDTYSDAVKMKMLTFSGCEQLRATNSIMENIGRTMSSPTCSLKPQGARDQIASNAKIMKDTLAQCLEGLAQIKSGLVRMKAEGKK